MCAAISSFSLLQSCSAQTEEIVENKMEKEHICSAKCTSEKCDIAHKEKGHQCTASCSDVVDLKSVDVQFNKNKVYEIVYFTITKGKEKQVFEDYMPKAAPFFEKYGVKSVGMFSVVENRSETLQSTMVGIFEWPNYESKENLESDKEFQKIAKLRDGGFSFFKGGWFATAEDKKITFKSDKVYEMVGASFYPTEEAKKSLEEYFKISEPIKRSYGGSYPEFLVQFAPSNSNGTATYSHEMQIIVEWNSLEDNKKLFANEAFKTEAIPLMKKAIEKSDFVFTKFIFN